MPEAITEAQQRAARAAGAAIRELIPAVRTANLPMLDYLLLMVLVETDRIEGSQVLTVEKG
jgi:hypothetical protein